MLAVQAGSLRIFDGNLHDLAHIDSLLVYLGIFRTLCIHLHGLAPLSTISQATWPRHAGWHLSGGRSSWLAGRRVWTLGRTQGPHLGAQGTQQQGSGSPHQQPGVHLGQHAVHAPCARGLSSTHVRG